MPYKEKYPLNPTPQGDSTKDAVLKTGKKSRRLGMRFPHNQKAVGAVFGSAFYTGKTAAGSIVSFPAMDCRSLLTEV